MSEERRKELAQVKRRHGKDSREAAKAGLRLGNSLQIDGDYEGALAAYNEALFAGRAVDRRDKENRRLTGDEVSVLVARICHNLGILHLMFPHQSRLSKHTNNAILYLRDAYRARKRRTGEGIDIALSAYHLGRAYSYANEPLLSLEYLRSAVETALSVLGEDHFYVRAMLHQIRGVHHQLQGKDDLATQSYSSASSILNSGGTGHDLEHSKEDDIDVALVLHKMGCQLTERNHVKLGIWYLVRAYIKRKECLGLLHADTCDTLYQLGRAYVERMHQTRLPESTITKMMDENSIIDRADFSHRGVSDKDVAQIAYELSEKPSIADLHLDHNIIGDDGAVAISYALHHSCSISNICLDSNKIGNDGAAALSYAVRHSSSIMELSLRSNAIGREGAEAIYLAFHMNSMITEVSLKNNEIEHIEDADVIRCWEEVLAEKMKAANTGNQFHIELAVMQEDIGSLYHARGDLDSALNKYENSLQMKEKIYGTNTDNKDLAQTLHNLGVLYRDRGDLENARQMLERSLKMKRRVYGSHATNVDIAQTIHRLGYVYHDFGDLNKAQEMFEAARAMVMDVCGADIVNATFASMEHNIGALFLNWGELDIASVKFEETLKIQMTVYGSDANNLDLATTLDNLGVLYYYQGKIDAARTKYEESLAMQRQIYGESANNMDIALTLHSLGILYHSQRNYEAARDYYEECLRMMFHTLKQDAFGHPQVQLLQENIAKLERYTKSANRLKRTWSWPLTLHSLGMSQNDGSARERLEDTVEMIWHSDGNDTVDRFHEQEANNQEPMSRTLSWY